MCGLPASGKNTWIAKYLLTHSNFTVVELDEIRSEIFGHQFHRPAEQFVIGMAKSFCRLLLKQKKNVIINSTGLTEFIRNDWMQLAKLFNADVTIVWVRTDLATCYNRNKLRPKNQRVPKKVIEEMYAIFQEPYYHANPHYDLIGIRINQIEVNGDEPA